MEPEKQAWEIQSQAESENNEACLIGHLLKEAREEKKLTIPEVAKETRIRQVYIIALEEGALDQLPGEIYKIGFLKTYAGFLGLDVFEILRRLDLNQDVQVSYARSKIVPTEAQAQPSRKVLYLSIIGALSFSIFAYVSYKADDTAVPSLKQHLIPEKQEIYSQETQEQQTQSQAIPKQEVDNQSSAPSVKEVLPSPAAESSDLADTEHEEGLADHKEILLVEGVVSSSTPTVQEQGLRTPSEQVSGVVGKTQRQAESKSQITGNSDSNEGKVNTNTLLAEGKGSIILKAVKDTWVQVLDTSGKTVYVRLMHAGDVYHVPGEGEYTLNTGNAGGLMVDYKGHETKLLGTAGQVIRNVHLTESGLQEFY